MNGLELDEYEVKPWLYGQMPNASVPNFALTQCDFQFHLNLWVIRAHQDIRPYRRAFSLKMADKAHKVCLEVPLHQLNSNVFQFLRIIIRVSRPEDNALSCLLVIPS